MERSLNGGTARYGWKSDAEMLASPVSLIAKSLSPSPFVSPCNVSTPPAIT